MKIEILPQEFAVCKVRGLPQELLEKEFVFFSHTDRELSLVCPKSVMPLDYKTAETGWRGMRIQGQLGVFLDWNFSKNIYAAGGKRD